MDIITLFIHKNRKILTFIFLLFITNNCSHAYAQNQIEIISINPTEYSGDDYDNNTGLGKECKKWHLNKEQIIQIFRLSEPYTNLPHLGFLILHCDIKGTLKSNGKILNFNINAGSTATISTDTGSTYYGCKQKQCKKFFLEPYDNEEFK